MKKSIEEALSLDDLKNICLHCKNCGLADTRRNVVFGEGRANADIFLLGEAPGAHEDETGRPFVGRAGELLNRLLAAAGLERDHVFITGSAKCRPPKNRNPYRNELAACYPYLECQLALIRPKVVVCLGLVAVQNLLNTRVKMADVRGCWFEGPNYRILPTYHPAAVLRGTVKQEVLIKDFITVAAQVKTEKM
jgi:DNA polymerase